MKACEPVISVIVPVYNTEKFLSRCLDSIINQTYTALDIILIDDGSTDNSGAICDAYAAKDSRIRVFHKENGGVSTARNLGVEKAMDSPTTYLSFVDSDDWIELDMLEILVKTIAENNADMVICSPIVHFPDENKVNWQSDDIFRGFDTIKAYLTNKYRSELCFKLWKKALFEGIVFPVGKTYEDLARMSYLILKTECVVSISKPLYHYFRVEDSLTSEYTARNMTDYWLAHKERFDVMTAIPTISNDPELMMELYIACAKTIAKAWRKRWRVKERLTKEQQGAFNEMSLFSRQHRKELSKVPGRYNRYCIFLSQYNNTLSFFLAFLPSILHRYAPREHFKRT